VRLAGNCVSIASVRDTGVFSSQKKTKGLAQRVACRFADCVLANSNAVRQWLITEGVNAEKIRVIPNGIKVTKRSTPDGGMPVRGELGIDPAAPVVAVVCRLMSGKGVEFFLQAIPSVLARVPAARFLVIGDSYLNPSYKLELRRQADALNLGDRVILTGQRNDVPAILDEVTLAVLPSLSEGFSNSLLEAMAARLPVIATNVGGNPEIVRDGETGILIPPRNVEALSRAMIAILESPELARRFGAAGQERVISRFSLDATVRQTQELYWNLLEQRGRYVQSLSAA
jgi:glycosyltransferase involved in cell wall biosynthesis